MKLPLLFVASIIFSLIFPLSVFAGNRHGGKLIPSRQSPDNRLYTANFLDTPPQFPGGSAALKQFIDTTLIRTIFRIDYEGIITLRFEIDTLGIVHNLVAVGEEKEMAHVLCGKSLLTMPRWLPGMLQGRKVRSLYSLSVVMTKI